MDWCSRVTVVTNGKAPALEDSTFPSSFYWRSIRPLILPWLAIPLLRCIQHYCINASWAAGFSEGLWDATAPEPAISSYKCLSALESTTRCRRFFKLGTTSTSDWLCRGWPSDYRYNYDGRSVSSSCGTQRMLSASLASINFLPKRLARSIFFLHAQKEAAFLYGAPKVRPKSD